MRGCIKTLAIISTTYLTHTPTHFIFRQLFINLYRQIHFHQFNLALRPTHTRRAFIYEKFKIIFDVACCGNLKHLPHKLWR